MRARKGSFNVSDVTGTEAAGSPPEEGGPSDGALAKGSRGECLVGTRGGSQPHSALHQMCLLPQVGAGTSRTSPGPSLSRTLTAAWTPAPAQVKGPHGHRGEDKGTVWLVSGLGYC